MPFEIKIQDIVSESYCYEHIRNIRWANGVCCPTCQSQEISKNGGSPRQRYLCTSCGKNFDDLTDTIFSGSKLPLKFWVLCLYFMGLNLSNSQIAKELDVSLPTAQKMTQDLREALDEKKLIYSLAMRLSSMKFTL